MVVWMVRLSDDGEHPADLAGGQPDQLTVGATVIVIMLPGCRGKLSTGGGAPFERR